jgi:hypothetical protein
MHFPPVRIIPRRLNQGIARTPILKERKGTSVAMDDKKKKKQKKKNRYGRSTGRQVRLRKWSLKAIIQPQNLHRKFTHPFKMSGFFLHRPFCSGRPRHSLLVGEDICAVVDAGQLQSPSEVSFSTSMNRLIVVKRIVSLPKCARMRLYMCRVSE